jgi:hypothetical protein
VDHPEAPPGSSTNSNGFNRTTSARFPERPSATTVDTIDFAFEGITDEADRNKVMVGPSATRSQRVRGKEQAGEWVNSPMEGGLVQVRSGPHQ